MSTPTKITIEIDLGNAVFHPCTGTEVARILRHYLDRIEFHAGLTETDLFDTNGNTCGSVTLEGTETP